MARPTVLTPEIAAAVCDKLAEVGSLRRVCVDPAMPLERTVRRWYVENDEFASAYARAKEAGIDALVDESMDIIDEPPPSTESGATDTGHVAWAKARTEYRRWLAERMSPKKYGARTGLDVTNSDGTLAVDPTMRAARVAALLRKAEERKALDDISDIV